MVVSVLFESCTWGRGRRAVLLSVNARFACQSSILLIIWLYPLLTFRLFRQSNKERHMTVQKYCLLYYARLPLHIFCIDDTCFFFFICLSCPALEQSELSSEGFRRNHGVKWYFKLLSVPLTLCYFFSLFSILSFNLVKDTADAWLCVIVW